MLGNKKNRYIVTIEIESDDEMECFEKYIGRNDGSIRICGLVSATKVLDACAEREDRYYRDAFERSLKEHVRSIR